MSARESITLNAELYELKERLSFGEIRYGEVTAVGDGGGLYTDIEVPVHVDAVEVGTVRISANVYYHSDPLDKAPGKVLFQINGYVRYIQEGVYWYSSQLSGPKISPSTWRGTTSKTAMW